MLKKFIAIFFLTVYAATSMGTTVFTHFCMNHQTGTSLWHTAKCGKCGMTEKQGKGCCKDELKLIKLSADHIQVVAANLKLPDLSAPAIITHAPAQQTLLSSSIAVLSYGAHSPPGIRLKRNILYSIFRI